MESLHERITLTYFRPTREHTEIEEELHETAHIDYDRVEIVSFCRILTFTYFADRQSLSISIV